MPRQGKDYITALRPRERGPVAAERRTVRSETSNANDLTDRLRRRLETRTQGDRGVDRERARAARRELAAPSASERAAYHRARYGGGDRADARAAAQERGSGPSSSAWVFGSASSAEAGRRCSGCRGASKPGPRRSPTLDFDRSRRPGGRSTQMEEDDLGGRRSCEIEGERVVVLPDGDAGQYGLDLCAIGLP